MTLRYIDQVPTVAGWYWERRANGVRIIELPYCGNWPMSWQERKAAALALATPEEQEKLAKLPDEQWRVEYAGPIPPPMN